jgi:ribosome-associated protein
LFRQEKIMATIDHRFHIPDSELEWSFVRASGPGGQNVNKVASKAVLRWHLKENTSLPDELKARLRVQQHGRITLDGDLVLTSQRYRDQERNRQDCLDKLIAMVQIAATPPRPRRPTRPTRGSREARLKVKQHRAGVKAGRRRPPED